MAFLPSFLSDPGVVWSITCIKCGECCCAAPIVLWFWSFAKLKVSKCSGRRQGLRRLRGSLDSFKSQNIAQHGSLRTHGNKEGSANRKGSRGTVSSETTTSKSKRPPSIRRHALSLDEACSQNYLSMHVENSEGPEQDALSERKYAQS